MENTTLLKAKDRNETGRSLNDQHRLIIDLVEEGSRVIDLGCGEGELLSELKTLKKVKAEGIELSDQCIQACVAKGIFNVQHGDLDEGLAHHTDQSFDYVILTNTLQVLHRPKFLIQEMARVGKKCIISFPNFAFWPVRLQLLFRGRMPRTSSLPYDWYDSPNIHHTTLADFRSFCERFSLEILQEIPLRTLPDGHSQHVSFLPNLLADSAIYVVQGRKIGDTPVQ
jgi:methionine biosynthesis protein MetW